MIRVFITGVFYTSKKYYGVNQQKQGLRRLHFDKVFLNSYEEKLRELIHGHDTLFEVIYE